MHGQIQTIAVVIQTVAIVASAVLAFVAVLWARRIARRRATLDIFLMEETKPEWIEKRRKFDKLLENEQGDLEKYATKALYFKPEAKSLRAVLNQYELVSIGVHRKIIDEKSYKDWCRDILVADWIDCKSYVYKFRETNRDKLAYNEFEKLAKRWATSEDKPHV